MTTTTGTRMALPIRLARVGTAGRTAASTASADRSRPCEAHEQRHDEGMLAHLALDHRVHGGQQRDPE